MHVGQQKYINLIKVYNIETIEIVNYSGVSGETIKKFKEGGSVYASKFDLITEAIESIIKYRKSLK